MMVYTLDKLKHILIIKKWRYLDVEKKDNEWKKYAKYGAAGVGGAVIGIAILPGIGFTASGVAAGSLAATIQSAIGNVAAGSAFATLQSIGSAGIMNGTAATIGAGIGIMGKRLYDKLKNDDNNNHDTKT